MRSHPNPLPPKDVAQRAEYQAATVSVAIGGDCLADIAQLRAEPAVFGHVASDPTVSRLIDTLASDATAALKAIDTARAAARARAIIMDIERQLGFDPASASAPFVATLVDVTGLVIYFSIAAMILGGTLL